MATLTRKLNTIVKSHSSLIWVLGLFFALGAFSANAAANQVELKRQGDADKATQTSISVAKVNRNSRKSSHHTIKHR